jgi:hypothetical protein
MQFSCKVLALFLASSVGIAYSAAVLGQKETAVKTVLPFGLQNKGNSIKSIIYWQQRC